MKKRYYLFGLSPEQQAKFREQRVQDLTEQLLSNNNTVNYPLDITGEEVEKWYVDYEKAQALAEKLRAKRNDNTIEL